jgi:hypothetical protein
MTRVRARSRRASQATQGCARSRRASASRARATRSDKTYHVSPVLPASNNHRRCVVLLREVLTTNVLGPRNSQPLSQRSATRQGGIAPLPAHCRHRSRTPGPTGPIQRLARLAIVPLRVTRFADNSGGDVNPARRDARRESTIHRNAATAGDERVRAIDRRRRSQPSQTLSVARRGGWGVTSNENAGVDLLTRPRFRERTVPTCSSHRTSRNES